MWKIQNVNKNQNKLVSFKVSASKNQMLEDEKYQREAFQTLLLRQDDRAAEIQVSSYGDDDDDGGDYLQIEVENTNLITFSNSSIAEPIGDGTEWACSADHGGDEEEGHEGIVVLNSSSFSTCSSSSSPSSKKILCYWEIKSSHQDQVSSKLKDPLYFG